MISTIHKNPEISIPVILFAVATLAIRAHRTTTRFASQIATALYTAFSTLVSTLQPFGKM